MPKLKHDPLLIAVEVVEAQSYKDYSDCFSQLAEHFKSDKLLMITCIKAEHGASGHRIKVHVIRDVLKPKITKKNELVVGLTMARL